MPTRATPPPAANLAFFARFGHHVTTLSSARLRRSSGRAIFWIRRQPEEGELPMRFRSFSAAVLAAGALLLAGALLGGLSIPPLRAGPPAPEGKGADRPRLVVQTGHSQEVTSLV